MRRAWLSVTIPSVQHASRSSSFTPRIMSSTRSNCGPSLTSRQAAPMQNRVAPSSFARLAAARTASTSMSGSASTPVWYRAAWGQ